MEGGRRRIDRVLAPGYLDDLATWSMADLRSRRSDCEDEEALLSYERRLLHGRLDILKAEAGRRAGDSEASIVTSLHTILADEPRPSRGAFPRDVAPPTLEHPKRRVEKLVSDDTLARLGDLSDEELASIAATLAATESEVSEQRRQVQRVLDELTQEVVRRYKSGEADPTDVLTGR